MAIPASENTSSLEKWMHKEFSKLLDGALVGSDPLKYILSMGSFDEVEDYISDLVGEDNPRRSKFIAQLRHRWHQMMGPPPTPPTTSPAHKVGKKLPPPPGLEKKPQNVDIAALQHGMTSSSETKAGVVGKGAPPPVGSTEGDPPQGTAVKGKPLHTQPNAYKKPKHGDLAYVPASATQKRDNQQKGGGGHYPSRQQDSSSGHKLHNGIHGVESQKGNPQKKQKYVTLTSTEGQTRMTMCFPGRHVCECLAQKHELVNNCTECGRIVCVQEGGGPCVTCGALVCTPEEQALLSRDSKKASKLRESLMRRYDMAPTQSGVVVEGLKDPQTKLLESRDNLCRAMDHKEKLLEFDRTSTRRTKVIDDESDYFSTESNRWISDTERKALQQKEEELREIRHGSRLSRPIKVDLDFAGRRVVEEEQLNDMYDERHVADLLTSEAHQSFYTPPVQNVEVDEDSLVNPTIAIHPPQYIPVADMEKKYGDDARVNVAGPLVMRIQDRPLQEMRDEGKCLSMHQPWASLLVFGIKKVEGRTWYTPHRGRLWIASVKYMTDGEEIAAVEQQYRDLYDEPDLAFPREYPTGRLLGAVDVLDCMTQEDFQAQYHSPESQSPYVLVASNPQHLNRDIPVQGQHKIWQLPSDVHAKAKKLIQVSTSRTSRHNPVN